MYYVKEHGFYYEKKHGPYATLKEAMAKKMLFVKSIANQFTKPPDKTFGREESCVVFTIESTEGTVQLLTE